MCANQVAAPVEDRSSWEVFYSYPSISAPAFFGAAAAAVQQRPDADACAADAFEDLHELAKAVQVFVLIRLTKSCKVALSGLADAWYASYLFWYTIDVKVPLHGTTCFTRCPIEGPKVALLQCLVAEAYIATILRKCVD